MAPIIGAYFSNWSVYDSNHFPQHLPPSLTHVFYAFMKPNINTGCVDFSDTWADLQMSIGEHKGAIAALMQHRSKHPSLKVIVSIGGWGTHKEFDAITRDLEKQSNFVNSVIDIVQKFDFDGVDIDWEFPSYPEEGARFLNLLRLLRKTLNYKSPELILSVAAPSFEGHVNKLDVSAIDRLVLFWNIMCYDFAGNAWSSRVGYHSNLYGYNGDNSLNTDSTIRMYIMRGASPCKIVLGMPMYGRLFSQPDKPQIGSHFERLNEGVEDTIKFRDIDRSTEVFDRECVAAIAYDTSRNMLITYDNERSATIKAQYVKANGLGGGFWWDSAGNTPNYSLINSFVANLR